MKSDMSRCYHIRIIISIIYSAIISYLVEILLATSMFMTVRHMKESGRMNRLLQAALDYHVAAVSIYVVSGLALFVMTFTVLQESYIHYINNISGAVQSISGSNLNTTIDVIGDDEFSSMAANLNRMAEDTQGLMDREGESERTKNKLITNMAHDLRIPLTFIIGYLELPAGSSKIPAGMQCKYIETAYGKARHPERLIEGLLGFTKLNYGRISMYVPRLNVVELLGQFPEEAYPNFAEKNLPYDLQSNISAKIMTADGNLLARLFNDLIDNAIKYGADGKRVLVKILAQGGAVTVSITDYGYATPPEELPPIFSKFYRVEQSRSSSTGGAGLRLAITKEIADIRGGTINVTSGLDGTVLTIELQVNFNINKENFGTIN